MTKNKKRTGRNKEGNKNFIKVLIKNHKDTKNSHPHVILEDIEDKHVSVGLSTHPKKGKNSPNYKLEQDPLDSGKESYMRRQGTVSPKKNYIIPELGKCLQMIMLKLKNMDIKQNASI